MAKGIHVLRAMNETDVDETPFTLIEDPKSKEVEAFWGFGKKLRGVVGDNK